MSHHSLEMFVFLTFQMEIFFVEYYRQFPLCVGGVTDVCGEAGTVCELHLSIGYKYSPIDLGRRKKGGGRKEGGWGEEREEGEEGEEEKGEARGGEGEGGEGGRGQREGGGERKGVERGGGR